MLTLAEILPGSSARITRVHGSGRLKRRIMDMGLIKGTEVYVRKVAPFGDPMEISIRGYELVIRASEVQIVEVERI